MRFYTAFLCKKSLRLLSIFFFLIVSFISGQNTTPCEATVLCESKTLNNAYPGESIVTTIKSNCSVVNFTRTVYYKVIVKSGNKFTFKIKPQKMADYDWAVWKNVDCNSITNIKADRFSTNDGIRSYSLGYAPNWDTGMDVNATPTCLPNGSFNNGMVAALDVQPGDELLIAIDLAQSYNGVSDYELVFGGINGGSGNATFFCIDDYPDTFYVCDINNDKVENDYDLSNLEAYLIRNYLNGDNSYKITFFNSARDITRNINPITKINIASKEKVYCRIEKDDIEALVIPLELVEYPQGKDIIVNVCKEEDLNKFNNLLTNTPNVDIKYYSSLVDAENENNPLGMPVKITDKKVFYAVIKNVNGCSIIRKVTTLLKVSNPQVSDTTICYDSSATLTVTNPQGTIRWYDSAGNLLTSGNSYTTPNLTTTTVYQLEQEYDGCVSERQTVTVTVKPQVEKPTVSDTAICYDSSATLTVTNPQGTIRWYDSAGNLLTSGNSYTTPNLTTTTVYQLEQEYDRCVSERQTVTVTVKPQVEKPTVSDTTICYDSSATLTVTNPQGTIRWYDSAGNLLTSGNSYTTPNLTTTTVYQLEQEYDGCVSERQTVTVTVKPQVEKPTVSDTTICYDSSATLTVTNPQGTIRWYDSAGNLLTSGNSYTTPNLTTTTVYQLEQEYDGCVSERQTVTVTVKPQVEKPTVSDTTICYDSSATLTVTNPQGTIRWYDSAGNLLTSGNSYTTPNLTTTTVYQLEQEYDGCVSERQTVTVTVKPQVDLPQIANTTICYDSSATLTVTNPQGTIRWYDSAGNLLTSGNSYTTPNLTTTTVYQLEQEYDGCVSERQTVTVTVKPQVEKPTVSDTTICYDSSATLTVTNPQGTIRWYDSAGNLLTSGNSYTTPNLTTTTVYQLEQEYDGCVSERQTVTVTVKPQVDLPQIANTTICYDSSATLTVTNPQGTIRWYDSAGNLLTSGNSYTTPNLTTTTVYQLEQEYDGCVSERQTVTVTVKPQVDLPQIANTTICYDSSATLTVTNPQGTIRWYDSAGNLLTSGNSYTTPNLTTTTVYQLEQEYDGCVSERQTVTVTVKPQVDLPQIANTTICYDSSATLTVTNPQGTIRWYDSAGNLLTSGNSYTTPNLTTTTVYQLEQEYDGCVSERQTVTVTVKPQVDLPQIANTTICYDSSATLTVTNPQGTIRWYDSAGNLLTSGNSYTTPNLTTTTVYQLEQEYDGCVSERQTVTVTVKPQVDLPQIANTTICYDSSATLTVTNPQGTIRWYDSAGNLLTSGNSYTTPNLTTTTVYQLEQEYDGCVSERQTVTVTVKPQVEKPTVSDTTICYDSSATLTVTNPQGTIRWYDSAGNLLTSGNSYTTPNLTTTTVYQLEQEYDGCVSERQTVTVTVKPQVEKPTVSDTAICYDSSATLTVTNPQGTIRWYDSAGNLLTSGNSYTTPNLTTTTVYQLEQEYDRCVSERQTVTVTVKPQVEKPTVSDTTICYDSSATLTVTNPQGTIRWYDSAGNLLTSGNSYTTPNLTTTTVYQLEQEYDGCVSERQTVTVTVKPQVEKPTVSDTTICYDSSATLTVTNPQGTIRWYDSAGNLLTSGNSYTTPNLTTTTVYQLEQEYDGCVSERQTVTVTVKPQVEKPTVSDTTICYDSSATLTVTNPQGTIRWYDSAGNLLTSGNSYTTPNLTTTTVYQLEQEYDGCVSERQTVTVTVKPQVDLPQIANTTICYDSSATLTVTNPQGTIRWYDSAGNLLTSGNSYTTPNLTTTTVYQLEQEYDGCVSERQTVTVTVKPQVEKPTVSDTTICYDSSATLTVTNPQGTIRWYDSAGNLLTSGNSYTTPNLTTTTVYQLEQEYDGCVSERQTVTVTVKPQVDLPQIANTTICYDSSATLTVTNAQGTIRWYDSLGNLLTSGSSYTTPNLTTTTIYQLEQEYDGCVSERQTVTVTVKPQVEKPTVPDTTICYDSSATLTVTNAQGTIRWYDSLGNLLTSGSSYTTPNLTTTTVYQLEQEYDGCVSERQTVTVTVKPQVEKPTVSDVTICAESQATLVVTNMQGNILWYNALGQYIGTGKTIITEKLFNNTNSTISYKYYAEQEISNCVSKRTEVIVFVESKPQNPKLQGAVICSGIQAQVFAIESKGEISWYDSKKGGKLIGTGKIFTTNNLYNTTNAIIIKSYYAEQKFCNNISERVEVQVQIMPEPKIKEVIRGVRSLEIIPAFGEISDYWYSIDNGRSWQGNNKFTSIKEVKPYKAKIKNVEECVSENREVSIIELPNIISPNGDGINDIWEVKGIKNIETISLKIFDRYGKVVYETTDPNKTQWNGKYLGRSLPSTTYWYVLEWKEKDGELERLNGWILLKNAKN